MTTDTAPQYQPQVSPPHAGETVESILTAAGCPASTAQNLAGTGMNEAQARYWASRATQTEGGVGWTGLLAAGRAEGMRAYDEPAEES